MPSLFSRSHNSYDDRAICGGSRSFSEFEFDWESDMHDLLAAININWARIEKEPCDIVFSQEAVDAMFAGQRRIHEERNANSHWYWDPKGLWDPGSNEFKLVQVSWLVGNALERIARNYYMQECWDILRKELFAMGHKSSVIARKSHIADSCNAMSDAFHKNEPLPQLHVGFRIAQAHEIVGHACLVFR
jgi:hypothetical protein